MESWVARAEKDPDAARKLQWFAKRAPEELYDIEKDPWELRNLAADPQHAETLKRMREQCDAWMKSQGDKG